MNEDPENQFLKDILEHLSDSAEKIHSSSMIIESLMELFTLPNSDMTAHYNVIYYEYNSLDKCFQRTTHVFNEEHILITTGQLPDKIKIDNSKLNDTIKKLLTDWDTHVIDINDVYKEPVGFFLLLSRSKIVFYVKILPELRKIISCFINSCLTYEQIIKEKEAAKLYSRLYIDEKINAKLFKNIVNKELNTSEVNKLVIPEKKQVIILSTDIAGFTSFSEKMNDASELMRILNIYLEKITNTIKQHDGVIDKFLGDGALILFNIIDDDVLDDSVYNAAECALQIYNDSVKFLNEKYRDQYSFNDFFGMNNYNFKIRIGVDMGEVCIGNIGGKYRCDYTVIGKNVNRAVRIQTEGKYYNVPILISEDFRNKLLDCTRKKYEKNIRPLARGRPVHGIEEKGLNIYQLIDNDKIADKKNTEFYEMYKNAFSLLYDQNDYENAMSLLLPYQSSIATDIAAQSLLIKCFQNIRKKIGIKDDV